MKRIVFIILCIGMVFVPAGCGGSGSAGGSGQNTAGQPDVDLTDMSATMVYSEVYNMVNTPDDYDGKVIKMTGISTSFSNESSEETYHACIVQDATACCQQGLEYTLTDEGDYPEDDKEITIQGTFQKCTVESGLSYGVIVDAKVL